MTMNKNLLVTVKLWGHTVGMLLHDTRDRIFFQYNPDFIKTGLDISPIKLKPKIETTQTTYDTEFAGLPSVFYESLPDNYGMRVLERHFKDTLNIAPHNISPLQKLMYIGKRGIGALEYEPAEKSHTLALQSLEVSELVMQAKKAIQGDMDGVITEVFKEASSSIGGAKAKATILWNKNTNDVLSGHLEAPNGYEHWIIKFDGISEDRKHKDDTVLEYIYLAMAQKCGIRTAICELFEQDTLSHLMIKRFDRDRVSKPYHMLSLASMLGVNFRDRNDSSYETFMRNTQAICKDRTELEEVFRRLVFNVLSGNQDDHSKNHSFVMDKEGTWRLSPAYDLTPSFGNGHQMLINSKSRGVVLEDLYQIAESFGIANAKEIVEFQSQTLSEFRRLASDYGVNIGTTEKIAKNMKITKPIFAV